MSKDKGKNDKKKAQNTENKKAPSDYQAGKNAPKMEAAPKKK